jgi:hypothetical protein
MQAVEFKLKQASAVLGVSAKDLQNLVQLKVIRPERRDNIYWFDCRLLLEAKVAVAQIVVRFPLQLPPVLLLVARKVRQEPGHTPHVDSTFRRDYCR